MIHIKTLESNMTNDSELQQTVGLTYVQKLIPSLGTWTTHCEV